MAQANSATDLERGGRLAISLKRTGTPFSYLA